MVFTLISHRGTMDISEDTKNVLLESNKFNEENLKLKFSSILFLECTELMTFLGKNGIPNSYSKSIKILQAHGVTINKDLYFFDIYDKEEPEKCKIIKVQDWINQNDKKNKILVVFVCNTENIPLKTKEAILIYSNSKEGVTGEILGGKLEEKELRIILPKS
jgi:hypothetical protein